MSSAGSTTLSACAYYDLDIVSHQAVDAVARRLDGSPVDHHWPADAIRRTDDPLSGDAIPSARSSVFRDELMQEVTAWSAAIREDGASDQLLRTNGIDVLEVARYEWFYALAPLLHRLWVLRRLTGGPPPDRLVWVTPAGQISTDWSRRVAQALAVNGTEFDLLELGPHHAESSDLTRRRAIPSRLRGRAARAIRLLRPARHAPPRAGTGTRMLFLEEYANAAKVLAPVARRLSATPGVDLRFVAAWPSVRDAAAGTYPVDDLPDLVDPATRAEAAERGDAVGRAAPGAIRAAVRPRLDAWGALAPLVDASAAETATTTWSKAAVVATLVDDVIDRFRPHLVVTSTFTGSAVRAAAQAVHERTGGGAAMVQHGRLLLEPWRNHRPHDAYVVWGDRDKRELLSAGVDPDRVVVTGSPHVDAVRSRLRAPAAPRRGARLVFVASLTGGRYVSVNTAADMLDAVVHTATVLHADLVVKPHPDDRSSLFAAATAAGVQVWPAADTVELMAQADVVVVSTSTAGFEACALDRPVVVMTPPGVEVSPEYAEYGAALFATDRAELERCVREILDGGSSAAALAAGRQRLVQDLFGGSQPGAEQRVTDALLTIAGTARAARET